MWSGGQVIGVEEGNCLINGCPVSLHLAKAAFLGFQTQGSLIS